MKVLVLRLNAKKNLLSPLQRTTYLGVVWDSTMMQALLSPARIDPHDSQESKRRPVTYCQAVSETAGSDGSCIQRDTFWPAVHETPTVVAQDQGFLPEGKRGNETMHTCLRHVEETLVLVPGPGAGSSISQCNSSDGCVPQWLGSGHEWPPCPWSVARPPSDMAH